MWMDTCLMVQIPRPLSCKNKSNLNEPYTHTKTCVCVCFIGLVSSFHPSSCFLSLRIKHVYQLSLHLASSSQHAMQLIESLNNRYSSGSVCASDGVSVFVCEWRESVCVCKGESKGGVVCKHDDALGCPQCTCQICLLIYGAHTHRWVLAVAGSTMCWSWLGASPVVELAIDVCVCVTKWC